jgi:hypothetical protein
VHRNGAPSLVGAATLAVAFLISVPLRAQDSGARLSGAITDSSGAGVPNARVAIKHLATGLSAETQADSAGHYSLPNLTPGDYELSATAEGFSATVARVTITADSEQTMNVTLRAGLSLEDLGFAPAQTQGNTQDQERLDRRSHMLMVHQRLGLITAVPMLATVITGTNAGGRRTSSPDRNAHAALGLVTLGLYLASASLAIRAPKVSGTETRGPIRLHKYLAWIHGPGMILTPILGAMAYAQRSRGEHVHGIAGAHGAVAIVTVAAYGAAILSVSIKF